MTQRFALSSSCKPLMKKIEQTPSVNFDGSDRISVCLLDGLGMPSRRIRNSEKVARGEPCIKNNFDQFCQFCELDWMPCVASCRGPPATMPKSSQFQILSSGCAKNEACAVFLGPIDP